MARLAAGRDHVRQNSENPNGAKGSPAHRLALPNMWRQKNFRRPHTKLSGRTSQRISSPSCPVRRGPCDKFSDYLSVPASHKLASPWQRRKSTTPKLLEVLRLSEFLLPTSRSIQPSPPHRGSSTTTIRDGSLLRKESGHPRMWPLLRCSRRCNC